MFCAEDDSVRKDQRHQGRDTGTESSDRNPQEQRCSSVPWIQFGSKRFGCKVA